jgi:hypothetical protein
MNRTPWIERRFDFDIPPGWVYNILERLHGTSFRLAELTKELPDDQASWKDGSQWSVKEHIGHLTDLEELHTGRAHDFVLRVKILRAADMTNQKTNLANHNVSSLAKLMEDFHTARKNFITTLERMDDETHHFQAMHPRLQKLMRPVDMAFFTAEHDDHHLASIRRIISIVRDQKK